MGAYHDDHRGGGERRADDARIFVNNFEELVTRLRASESPPNIDIDGSDLSGTVSCVVDMHGAVRRVSIDNGWWDSLGPARIAEAVLDAMRYARSKAAMARLVLDRHGRQAPHAPVDLGMLFTAEPSTPLPRYDADDFPEAVARKVARTMTILDEARQFSQARDGNERTTVTGPRGMFAVIRSGVTIVGAEVHQHGLHRSDAADLAADACAALQVAASPTHLAGRLSGVDR